MKPSVLLISILALSLAACGSRVVKESKETVIEKPVVSHETHIIEKPSMTREIIVEKQVPSPRSCAYGPTTFSSGSLTCQGGYQSQCIDGIWTSRSTLC